MLLVGVALLAVGEVVGVVDDEVVCACVADELVASSGEEESSLEDTAAGDVSLSSEPSLVPPLEPLPQESGSVGAFMRSWFLPEQRACIECSLCFDMLHSLKQQRPASCGSYLLQRYFAKFCVPCSFAAFSIFCANGQSLQAGATMPFPPAKDRALVNTSMGDMSLAPPSESFAVKSGTLLWLAHWIKAETEYCWTMQLA